MPWPCVPSPVEDGPRFGSVDSSPVRNSFTTVRWSCGQQCIRGGQVAWDEMSRPRVIVSNHRAAYGHGPAPARTRRSGLMHTLRCDVMRRAGTRGCMTACCSPLDAVRAREIAPPPPPVPRACAVPTTEARPLCSGGAAWWAAWWAHPLPADVAIAKIGHQREHEHAAYAARHARHDRDKVAVAAGGCGGPWRRRCLDHGAGSAVDARHVAAHGVVRDAGCVHLQAGMRACTCSQAVCSPLSKGLERPPDAHTGAHKAGHAQPPKVADHRLPMHAWMHGASEASAALWLVPHTAHRTRVRASPAPAGWSRCTWPAASAPPAPAPCRWSSQTTPPAQHSHASAGPIRIGTQARAAGRHSSG